MSPSRSNSLIFHVGSATALLAAMVAFAVWLGQPRRQNSAPVKITRQAALPAPREDAGFTTSQGCQQCHPAQHQSWHASYHRTMTQPARPDTVLGDFSDVTLEQRGYVYKLSREGDEFWVEMPDLDWFNHDVREPLEPTEFGRTKRRVTMLTGSHHYQVCWLSTGVGNLMMSMPYAYLIGDRRWVPRSNVFLSPYTLETQYWNDNCIHCHSVAPFPNARIDQRAIASQCVELGIACEACHGPGEAHVRWHEAHSDLVENDDDVADPTIVLPTRLEHRKSAQVCGQCHGLSVFKDPVGVNNRTGIQFRAGDELTHDRYIVYPLKYLSTQAEREAVWEYYSSQPDGLRSQFWDDGTIRVVGREYNGLIQSGCYLRGELSCVSCHSLHGGKPDDQLAPALLDNQACYQCHGEYRERLEAHTHHPAGSAGSQCMNCHMANTTYGLLKFTRGHRIDSPSVALDAHFGRPNACNLCHLDQSLAWTDEHLNNWYQQPHVELDAAQRSESAALHYALKGDALQRATIAWHIKWPPAREASGSAWLIPTAAQLWDDPYSAVRYLAAQSLRTLPGLEEFEFDYIADEPLRRAARERVDALWEERRRTMVDRTGPHVLLEPNGKPMAERIKRLLEQRDDRPVLMAE